MRRWSCLYTTLQVRGRVRGHVSTPHYRREGEVGGGGSCLYTTLQVRVRGGVMSLHHTTGERAM